MKIGFIIPCDFHNYRPFRNQPLNALYFLTILEKQFGEDVELSLIDLRGVNKDDAIYYVPENDIYLYSVATIDFLESIRMVQEIRVVYPKARHIAGGIHINIYHQECAKLFDVIAIGEGEDIIVEIIKDAFASKLKNVYTESRQVNINHYPYPDRKFLPKTAVVDRGLLNGEYKEMLGTTSLFSRGCMYKCDFCANLTQSALRLRTPELIVEEIEYLKRDYGVQALAMKDDTIISFHQETARKTLKAIQTTGIIWRGNSRASGYSKEILKLAKESGCVDLAVGVESVSQEALSNINKKLDLKKAKEFLKWMNEVGIGIRLNLIIGLPGEPKDIVKKSIEFIKEIQPSSVLLSILTPVPGSKMFQHPEKFGIKMYPNVSFSQLFGLAGRFDDSEKPSMVFEYEPHTPFGESMPNEEIINNYIELQAYLRENSLTF